MIITNKINEDKVPEIQPNSKGVAVRNGCLLGALSGFAFNLLLYIMINEINHTISKQKKIIFGAVIFFGCCIAAGTYAFFKPDEFTQRNDRISINEHGELVVNGRTTQEQRENISASLNA